MNQNTKLTDDEIENLSGGAVYMNEPGLEGGMPAQRGRVTRQGEVFLKAHSGKVYQINMPGWMSQTDQSRETLINAVIETIEKHPLDKSTVYLSSDLLIPRDDVKF